MGEKNDLPYRFLGARLKIIREKCHESLAQVSEALEIEAGQLEKIEKGAIKPSEDTLTLLITHLDVSDSEADKLLQLAGYNYVSSDDETDQDENLSKQIAMIMPIDSRIVYTDTVHVAVNNYGVVINFMQNSGQGGQPLAVSRVGMSREHAQSVLEVLKQTLEQSNQPTVRKILPAPKPKTDNQS